jgi:hypothetical protein
MMPAELVSRVTPQPAARWAAVIIAAGAAASRELRVAPETDPVATRRASANIAAKIIGTGADANPNSKCKSFTAPSDLKV